MRAPFFCGKVAIEKMRMGCVGSRRTWPVAETENGNAT